MFCVCSDVLHFGLETLQVKRLQWPLGQRLQPVSLHGGRPPKPKALDGECRGEPRQKPAAEVDAIVHDEPEPV